MRTCAIERWKKTKSSITKRYAVLATPPKSGIYKDLQPRYQMNIKGETVYYTSKQEAQIQADACNSDHNHWKYTVEEVE